MSKEPMILREVSSPDCEFRYGKTEEVHYTDAYWLREFSKAAMQGMLSDMRETDSYIQPNDDGKQPLCVYVADAAVEYATALLKAIKESEGKG